MTTTKTRQPLKSQLADVQTRALGHTGAFLMAPLMAFLLTPLIDVLYLWVNVKTLACFFDYQYIVNYAVLFALLAAVPAVYLSFLERRRAGTAGDRKQFIPAFFFAAVCVLMLVSTCVNGFTDAALEGGFYRGESIFSFFAYFAAFWFCGSLVKSDACRKLVFVTFFVSNIVLNLLTLIDRYVTPVAILEYGDWDAPSAIFYQFNHYGYFLMIGIMLSAALFATAKSVGKMVFYAVVLAVNTFILTLNTTFGCFLSCLVGMVFMLVALSIRDKKFSVKSVGALAVFLAVTALAGLKYHSFLSELALFFTDIQSVFGTVADTPKGAAAAEAAAADSAGTGRWGLWRLTLGYIKERPLFGWGVEGIASRLEIESQHVNNRPHNEYLQYAAFFGIPAAVAYIGGLAAVYLKAWRGRKRMSDATAVCLIVAFTYLFSAIFGNTMFYTAPYLFIFLGLGTVHDDNNT